MMMVIDSDRLMERLRECVQEGGDGGYNRGIARIVMLT